MTLFFASGSKCALWLSLAIKDKQGKRAAKKELLGEVLAWIGSDQEQAKIEFAESAAEVIAILKAIATQV